MIASVVHVARLARAGFVFAREGVFGIVDPTPLPPAAQLALRLGRMIERRERPSGPPAVARAAAARSGYVKLGQFLATRPDVVGVAMARELESLQDRLPPFPQSEAEAAIAAAFERPLTQTFASFGPRGRGCLDRAGASRRDRRATARQSVAVKILRPNVAARFKVDLDAFRLCGANGKRFRRKRGGCG